MRSRKIKLTSRLVIPLLLIACQLKTPEPLLDKVPAPEMTAFSIAGVDATIAASDIRLTLTGNFKPVSVTALTATYTAANAKVYVAGIRQTSGVTVNDFTNPVTYSVVSADLVSRSYTVTVTPLTVFLFSDTGQTQCYDDTIAQSCASVAGTHPRQDGAMVDAPAPRSFGGPTQHSVYTSDYTTTDNTTGLVWRTCSQGQSGPACATGGAATFSLSPDTTTCGALNTANSGAGYAGLTNWRIPTLAEIRSLANFSNGTDASESAYFPATSLNHYLSSTEDPNSGGLSVITMTFLDGNLLSTPKTSSPRLRCVAATSTNYTPRLQDNGDGTVTDQTNRLVWQKCSRGQTNNSTCSGAATFANWATALAYCQNLTLAGKTWRLPNVNELRSIVDYTTASTLINAAYYPATVAGPYWTSTTHAQTTANAWRVDFSTGLSVGFAKSNNLYVRCVSGP